MMNILLSNEQSGLRALRKQIERCVNLQELYTLYFDLGLNYDNVPGNTLVEKIVGLLDVLKRKGRISELIELLEHDYPNISWKFDSISKIDEKNQVPKADLLEPPIGDLIYLLELHELIKNFNRNRHYTELGQGSFIEGDDIAVKMLRLAPKLFGELNVSNWLNSKNPGKQLAAIKYLVWLKDIEYAESLATRLQQIEDSGDTFQTFHILNALYAMADQLAYDYKEKIKISIENYTPKGGETSSRAYVKRRILEIL